MNLEHVHVGKSNYGLKAFPPNLIQLPLFPKQSLRPAYRVSNELIDRTLRKLHDYLRRQLRHNCRPNTIRASGATLLLFLAFFKRRGGEHLATIGREHISAFVEHEQDRGMAPTSVDGRLKGLYAFLNFLVSRDVIGAGVVKRKLRIRARCV